jgi:SOS-response transcriptional repressor LexA
MSLRSMIEEHICDGDYAIITPQSTCQNGDIVVATRLLFGINGSATFKRFFQEPEQVRLQPTNSAMEPLFIPKWEWDLGMEGARQGALDPPSIRASTILGNHPTSRAQASLSFR